MIAVVIPTCDHHYVPPNYGTIPVFVVYDEDRRGFAASCNIGIAKAHAKGFSWILVCNDDIELSPLNLHTIISQIREDTGAISPLIVDDKGMEYAGISVSKWGRVRMITSRESTTPDSVIGTCMLVPSWARFDSQYLHGFEDIALCSFLRERGKKISVCRSAHCKHEGGGTVSHYSRPWFAKSIYGQLRFFSSPALSGIILGLGLFQARFSRENMKGVLDGYKLWKRQRSSRKT